MGEEEEGVTAELLPLADLLRRVSNVGGGRRRTARSRPSARLGLGFLPREKKEAERSKWPRGVSVCLQGGPGTRGGAVEGMVTRRKAAPVFPVTKVLTGEAHCQGFVLFKFPRKTSRVVAFI